jgi:MFS family permease
MVSSRLVMLVFFLQPLAFGSWLPRIPEIQARLAIGPAELALALLGLPVGTLLALPFAGPLVARIGARRTILLGFCLFLTAVCLPAFAQNIYWLFFGLLLTGMTMSVLELGLNVIAAETEANGRASIMSTCHGCWSLGMAAGSLMGVGFAALGVVPQWSVPIAAAVVAPCAVGIARLLPVWPAAEHPAEQARPGSGIFVPGPVLAGICLFAFGGTLVEGASADWSAVFLRDAFGADTAAAGIGYSIFAGLLTVGRLLGDFMKTRWGAVAVARACIATALAGVSCVVLSPAYAVALIGFGLAGFGVSVGFPLAVTAVAGLGDRPAAANVAMLSLITLASFLLGPPVIGLIAQHVGLRLGFAVLLPGLVASVVLAGLLARGAPMRVAAAAAE